MMYPRHVRGNTYWNEKCAFAISCCASEMDGTYILNLSCIVILCLPMMTVEILDYESLKTANCKEHNWNDAYLGDARMLLKVWHRSFYVLCCTMMSDSQVYLNFLLYSSMNYVNIAVVVMVYYICAGSDMQSMRIVMMRNNKVHAEKISDASTRPCSDFIV